MFIYYQYYTINDSHFIMIDKISELTIIILDKEKEIIDIVKNAPNLISILEGGFQRLKQIVIQHEFPSLFEEIRFFKEIKPGFFHKKKHPIWMLSYTTYTSH